MSELVVKQNIEKTSWTTKFKKYFQYNWQLMVLITPALVWVAIFVFLPFILNILMSMEKDYQSINGLFASGFVWFENYVAVFQIHGFMDYVWNTLALNLLVLVIGFPAAIILAIMIYESKSKVIKGISQTATFLPFFVSAVVACTMLIEFVKADVGMITNILCFFGMERQNILNNPAAFRWIYAILELWQTVGYNSLIYLAALSAIDTSLYEAAEIDGAGKFRKIWNVSIPGILPTIIITLILRLGKLMTLGYEKVLLLQNPSNKEVSEIISSFVYNQTLGGEVPNYSMGATIGLFDAVIAIILVTIVNKIAKKVSETALW